MQIPKIEPYIGAMPGFLTGEKYDPWETLAGIFGHYDLNRLRRELWDMYKSAMRDKEGPGRKTRRRHLTSLFETMNYLATAAYVAHAQKGFKLYYDVDPMADFFPMWENFDGDPWHVLFRIFEDFHLDEIRNELWGMYKSAVLNTGIYHTREQRYELIFLLERLNDLATAAYVVAKKKFEKTAKEKAAANSLSKP